MAKPLTAKERMNYIEGFLNGLRIAATIDDKFSDFAEMLEYVIEDLHCVEAEIDNKEG